MSCIGRWCQIKAAHPSVELEFVELTYVTHYAAVADGSVDVAFCRLPLGGRAVPRSDRTARPAHAVRAARPSVHRVHAAGSEVLGDERLVRMVPGSVNQEWQDYHFPATRPRDARSATGR